MAYQNANYWLGHQIGEQLAEGKWGPQSVGEWGPSRLVVTYREEPDDWQNERTIPLSHYHIYLGLLEALEAHGLANRIIRLSVYGTNDLGQVIEKTSDQRYPLTKTTDLVALSELMYRWPLKMSLPGVVEERWPVEQSPGLSTLAFQDRIPASLLYSGTRIRIETVVQGAEAALRTLVSADLTRYLRRAY